SRQRLPAALSALRHFRDIVVAGGGNHPVLGRWFSGTRSDHGGSGGTLNVSKPLIAKLFDPRPVFCPVLPARGTQPEEKEHTVAGTTPISAGPNCRCKEEGKMKVVLLGVGGIL